MDTTITIVLGKLGIEFHTLPRLLFTLSLAAVLSIYIRFLYHRFGSTISNIDAISRAFPLLTVVTAGVIAVVKSSLSLSLGLVGALSIVRFRTPIKNPEELVYLFLCIGVGVAAGADRYLIAVLLAFVATVVIVGQSFFSRQDRLQNFLLTIHGNADEYFSDKNSGALATVKQLTPKVAIQRYNVENGEGMMRVVLGRIDDREVAELVAKLNQRLPGCTISYLNMTNSL